MAGTQLNSRPVMGTELVIELTNWAGIWPEAEGLMAAHHEELEGQSPLAKRMPFQIDYKWAQALDSAGALSIVAARADGVLVGYCIWYLGPNLESAGIKVASQGPWYVEQSWRGRAGMKLFDRSLEQLRNLGVQCAYPHHWLFGGGIRLGEYFVKKYGAEELEHVYGLWIGA